MKKILFIGSEAMPFAATGGLGDVLGSLPAALAKTGEADVRVMMPLYGQIGEEWRAKMKDEAIFTVRLAWRNLYCGIKSLRKNGVTYYFIDNEYYFKRDALYGSYDDGERFAYFCMAAVASLEKIGFFPDVLHAHDWQAALSIVYLNCLFRDHKGYENIRTAFTIHNIEYQGQFHFGILGDVFSLDMEEYDRMDFGGCINLMKAAIVSADKVTTVSPRYAEEICTPHYGRKLETVLLDNKEKLSGILNGIDYVYYNPGTDPALDARYNWQRIGRKTENKTALQKALGLPVREDVPMLGIISRLAVHKGLDLITVAIPELLATQDVQLVVLGKGEAEYERFFRDLEAQFPNRVRALMTYDRDLSRRIYAATDIFLMPSHSEPCGLSQMIASRYGAIPVTRETGGLYDSIKGYYEKDGEIYGNGFTFANYSAEVLAERINAAIALWRDPLKRKRFLRKIMRIDFSWNQSAKSYLALYGTF